jgi:4'-phosphopantetheinyl transferase
VSAAAVTITYADLDATDADALLPLLSADEHERAARYRFALHRRRFIAGRGLLRTLLARRAGVDPGRLSFRYESFGKPHLAGGPAALAFNVAHSERYFALAVTEGYELGVDLETRRAIEDCHDLARHVFSDAEREQLTRELPAGEAFLRGWTRKEAVLKAAGSGLSADPKQVTVGLHAEPRQVRVIDPDGRTWTVVDLTHPDCVAAVAVGALDVAIAYDPFRAAP